MSGKPFQIATLSNNGTSASEANISARGSAMGVRSTRNALSGIAPKRTLVLRR
jgi:hypothetical protein